MAHSVVGPAVRCLPTMILGLTTSFFGDDARHAGHRGHEDPATAASLLDPVRTRLLEALAQPASATMRASRLRLPRQLVNYHLRTLERHGLVALEAERARATSPSGLCARARART